MIFNKTNAHLHKATVLEVRPKFVGVQIWDLEIFVKDLEVSESFLWNPFSKLRTKVVCRRYQQAIDHMDHEGQKMAEEELRRMESRCIIRICLTGYGEEFDDKFIKNTKAWFEIKVKRYTLKLK